MIKKINPLCTYLLIFSVAIFSLSGCGHKSEDDPFTFEDIIIQFLTGESPSQIESTPAASTAPSTELQTPPVTEAATEPPTEIPTEPVTEPVTEPSTQPPTEPVTELSTEVSTTPETEPPTEAPTEALLTIDDVAFIGDSRTLTMATGGRYEFNLIPSSSVFATWGGELTQDSAKQNAQAAAAADRDLAIFWYGINDVQSDPEQKLAPQFIANYEAIIDLYHNINPDSKIVILSILSTSVHEKDYYEGQEENILRYNRGLAALCSEKGYIYLDITDLFTGDECLAPDDYIHFSRDWYAHSFLPEVFSALGIDR